MNAYWDEVPTNEKEIKTIDGLTLGEIGGCDWEVYVTKSAKFGFNLDMECEDYVLADKNVHPYAVESIADFCEQFLHWYHRIKEQEPLED